MDFDKTSFSVDWFTPGDKYGPKRLSFPKSACISIDDLVSDSPLSFCFSPVDEPIPRPPTRSIVDGPFERAYGWTNSAPPSPLVPSPREPYVMYDQDPKTCEESTTDWRMLSNPGLLSIAYDCALCGVDLDASCLDALDDQLLLSPVECFIDLCWASAVCDDVTAPVVRRNSRSRARSFKGEHERAFLPPAAREYPGSFERARPAPAKTKRPLPLDTRAPYPPCPPYLSSPLSSEPHDASQTYSEEALGYALYADPEGRPFAVPALQDVPTPRHIKKRGRGLAPTPSVESFTPFNKQPSTPRLKTSKSSHALRAISDACATFARPGKRSPLAAP